MKKVIVATENLKPALKKLSQAVAKNSVIPVLSNVLVKVNDKEITLITTDLELTIMQLIVCESSGGSFEMLLPFDFLQKIISLSGLIPIEIQLISEKKAKILGEDDIYELNSLDKLDDFPKYPDLPKRNYIKLNSGFIDWLNRAMLTCGKDDTRPALTKACLDIMDTGLTIASTDSHFLFNYSMPIESKVCENLLISPKMAKAMEGFAEIEVYWHKNHIAFKSGDTTIIATRHEDKYPNYKAVIPSHPANLTLDRSELIGAIERASLANDAQIKIVLDKAGKSIKLISENEDFQRKTQIEIVGNYTGEAEHVAVNPKKLLVLLHQVMYDSIQLHIESEKRAVLLSCEEDKNYLGMIMPLLTN